MALASAGASSDMELLAYFYIAVIAAWLLWRWTRSPTMEQIAAQRGPLPRLYAFPELRLPRSMRAPKPVTYHDPKKPPFWMHAVSEVLSAIITAWALNSIIKGVHQHDNDDY